MNGGLVVVGFAGGGGSSVAIEQALGRPVDIGINHDAEALAMHAANHPRTRHYSQNIWQIDPLDAVRGKPVELAWFSPDCRHFSKAKGARPVKRHIRDLAWVVTLWAKRARPRLIFVENVEEFRDWGPVDFDGRPCPERRGETFHRWVAELRRLGYRVEWRELRACDYGAPTIRKRLFLVARCDGQKIVWPEPTHGPGLQPYRTAAEIIDWSLPCPSIFLTREEGRAIGVNRPLAEATMRRIARGVKRYVLEAAHPFIVRTDMQSGAARNGVHSVGDPARTITTCGGLAVVAPYFVQRYGERPGQDPRTRPVTEPIQTVVPTGNGSQLAAVHLSPYYGERRPGEARAHGVDAPLATQTTENRFGVIAAHMTRFNQNGVGHGLDEPAGTAMAGAPRFGLVAAFLAQHNTGMVGHDAREPVSTITGKGSHQQLVATHLMNMKGSERSSRSIEEPVPTVCASTVHAAEIRAFLVKYYGVDQDPRLTDPLHTVTTRDRFGVVTVEIAGEPYAIVDIGMRMLTPRELFRAQGFPDSYVIEPIVNGRPLTRTAQIRMCGNSVSPPPAAALVAANAAPLTMREVA